jgi:uncharacterized membrane protein
MLVFLNSLSFTVNINLNPESTANIRNNIADSVSGNAIEYVLDSVQDINRNEVYANDNRDRQQK